MVIDRSVLLPEWLQQLFPNQAYVLSALQADASFRRYYRVSLEDQRYIVMDAPPTHENSAYFATLARSLHKAGVNVPMIFSQDDEQGFLLLSDFGDYTLYSILNEKNVTTHYQQALKQLIHWQTIDANQLDVKSFDDVLFQNEFSLFTQWYLQAHCSISEKNMPFSELKTVFQLLLDHAKEQPQVLVHRDFHSRNLMVTDHALGILDFQDAVKGPITYDVVSLLKDCYIDWSDAVIARCMQFYMSHSKQAVSVAQWQRWFDLMGLQRHLKCLGIFSRLHWRDKKPQYLQAIPRLLQYIERVKHIDPSIKWLNDFLQTVSQ